MTFFRAFSIHSVARNVMVGLVVGLAGVLYLAAAPVFAATPGPGDPIESIPGPTVFSTAWNDQCVETVGGTPLRSCNSYTLTVTNSGSLATNGTPVTIRDTLPASMTAQFIEGEAPAQATLGHNVKLQCGLEGTSAAYCTFNGGVLTQGELLVVHLYAVIEPGVSGTVTNAVQVSGGGVSVPVAASFQNTVGSASPTPGLSNFAFTLSGLDGSPDRQAGDHPFAATASFQFATTVNQKGAENEKNQSEAGETYPPLQAVKDVVVDLPPGLVGTPRRPPSAA